jgi:hypothetical protein
MWHFQKPRIQLAFARIMGYNPSALALKGPEQGDHVVDETKGTKRRENETIAADGTWRPPSA